MGIFAMPEPTLGETDPVTGVVNSGPEGSLDDEAVRSLDVNNVLSTLGAKVRAARDLGLDKVPILPLDVDPHAYKGKGPFGIIRQDWPQKVEDIKSPAYIRLLERLRLDYPGCAPCLEENIYDEDGVETEYNWIALDFEPDKNFDGWSDEQIDLYDMQQEARWEIAALDQSYEWAKEEGLEWFSILDVSDEFVDESIVNSEDAHARAALKDPDLRKLWDELTLRTSSGYEPVLVINDEDYSIQIHRIGERPFGEFGNTITRSND